MFKASLKDVLVVFSFLLLCFSDTQFFTAILMSGAAIRIPAWAAHPQNGKGKKISIWLLEVQISLQ